MSNFSFRSSSTRHSNERTSDFDARQHFDAEILRFQKMLEEKETMLQTAADIGGQLLKQNEELQQRMREVEESKRRNQYENKQLQRQNDILRVAHEDAQAEIRQLREDILEKKEEIEHLEQAEQLRQTLSPSPRKSQPRDDSFASAEILDALDQITRERDVIATVVQEERQRSNDLTRKAEELQYMLSTTEKSNATLEQELMAMNDEFSNLQRDYEHEISRLSEENRAFKSENQLLKAQADEQQQLLARHDEFSMFSHPHTARFQDTGTSEWDFNLDDELVGESWDAAIGSRRSTEYHSDPEIVTAAIDADKKSDDRSSQLPPVPRRSVSDADASKGASSAKKRRKSTAKRASRVGGPSVDALEEFIHLTVTAAKINHADVPVSSSHLLNKVRAEKLPFHQVAGWLDAYLSSKRGKPISNTPSADPSPERHVPSAQQSFFKMLFGRNKSPVDLADNRQVKLQVRYQKRMFEVRMKRKDTLQTLALTIPRFLDHKPQDVVFYHRDRRLEIDETIDENKLMSNDAIRMMPASEVANYLKKYKRKLKKIAKTQSREYAPARTVTSPNSRGSRPPPPIRTSADGSRYRKFVLETLSDTVCLTNDDDVDADNEDSEMMAYEVQTIDLTSDFAKIAQKARQERAEKIASSDVLNSMGFKGAVVVLALGVSSVYVWRLLALRRRRVR